MSEALLGKFEEVAMSKMTEVVLDPVKAYLKQDVRQMSQSPDPCMAARREKTGELIKNNEKSKFQALMLRLSENEDDSFISSMLQGDFLKVLQTSLKSLKGWSAEKFATFQAKWQEVLGRPKEYDTWGRVTLLANKSICQEDDLTGFPKEGHVSQNQAEKALGVFDKYFTYFREVFNENFFKFMRGHISHALKEENNKFRTAIMSWNLDADELATLANSATYKAELNQEQSNLRKEEEDLKHTLSVVQKMVRQVSRLEL